jgi:ATP-dependent DNA helicase RecG
MNEPGTLIFERSLVKELGDRAANVLERSLGISTVGDLLRHYPRRYVVRGELSDISELKEGEEATVLARIDGVRLRRAAGRTILEVGVTDGSARLSLTFFNQAWREKELQVGRTAMFAGKVTLFNGKRQLSHPDYQLIPDGQDIDDAVSGFSGKFLPVYPSASKAPSWMIARCVSIVLDALEGVQFHDYLDPELLAAHNFPDLLTALTQVHHPTSLEMIEKSRERLRFDEAFLLQLILAQRRSLYSGLSAVSRLPKNDGLVNAFESMLPFSLTEGQRAIGQEIDDDLKAHHPMHRLLQGEVGSGKTVVALRALLRVVDAGGQGALLAPTEVLAQQHYATIKRLMGSLAEAGMLGSSVIGSNGNEVDGTQVVLLTGSMSAAAKRSVLSKIDSGEAGIVIGTHALLSDGVEFKDLGLVVVDEQHRFGVEQRDALRSKGKKPPHLLVMTATPIPRTVAMTIFGDLEISTLRQLPDGRTPIITHVISTSEKPHYLDRAWERMREEVSKGHQAYVVVPRINGDESEAADMTDLDRHIAKILDEGDGEVRGGTKRILTSVDELAPKLATGPLKGVKVAVLHGRLSTEAKDDTMKAFNAGEIDVLVATTVIEVGVDVPNATLMVIMDSERFGVSQLHQLRGRVGRGSSAGLCLLVTDVAEDSGAMARLRAVASTLDGFELSRIDLEQRSEGDVLGKAQSGVRSHLRLLKVLRDEAIIEKARKIAQVLISKDPELQNYPHLAAELKALRKVENVAYVDKG